MNVIEDVGRSIKHLITKDSFYGLFISSINKVSDENLPAMMAVSISNDCDITLLVNPKIWETCTKEEKKAVMEHEAKHLVFFHMINLYKYSNKLMANIAMDLEINQTIDHLPVWVVRLENYQRDYPHLDFSPLKGADHYYSELNKLPEEEKQKLGISSEAQHIWELGDPDDEKSPMGGFKQLTEAQRNIIKELLEDKIESVASEVKQCGNLPSDIELLIKGFKKLKPKYNYKKFIRTFAGAGNKYFIKSTRSKENRRFEGQPSVVIRPKQRMLVCIDESGSVGNDELKDFLNELFHLGKLIDLEIRPFDTELKKEVKYRKGDEFPRTACGGTDIQCCIDYFESNKALDTMIIFTDGYFEERVPPKKRSLVVISSKGTTDNIQNFKYKIKLPQND